MDARQEDLRYLRQRSSPLSEQVDKLKLDEMHCTQSYGQSHAPGHDWVREKMGPPSKICFRSRNNMKTTTDSDGQRSFLWGAPCVDTGSSVSEPGRYRNENDAVELAFSGPGSDDWLVDCCEDLSEVRAGDFPARFVR